MGEPIISPISFEEILALRQQVQLLEAFVQSIRPYALNLKRTAEIIECNDPGHTGNAAALRSLADLILEQTP
jgi:hypothetical protein